MGFFKDFRRQLKLQKLQAILGNLDLIGDIDDLLKKSDRRKKALNEYFELSMADPIIKKSLDEFSADKDTLHDIYWILMEAGAGQWISRRFISANALSVPQTLIYCLIAHKNGFKGNYDSEIVSYNLVKYFKDSMIGIPKEWIQT